MRDDYLQSALKVTDGPTILVNVVSSHVKQLRRGTRPLVVSLEKLSAEDTALREIAEGKITYESASGKEPTPPSPNSTARGVHSVAFAAGAEMNG